MKSMTPYEKNQEIARKTVPSMRYWGGEPFVRWQEKAREKLADLLGLPLESGEEEFQIEWEKEQEGYQEIRFHFQSEPGYLVPGHMLIPNGEKSPMPLVICLQGHSKGMHVSLGRTLFEGEENISNERDRNFAVQAVREGYIAVTLEQRGFGERGGTPNGPNCRDSSRTALLYGRTTVGERVWDVMRFIDVVLKHFPQADPEKIMCMGNSGGGTATFYAACMDERISLAMPSGCVCTYKDSIGAMEHCDCNYIPRIGLYFDMGDLGGLIAPRDLVVVSGKNDPIFPLKGAKESYEIIERMYRAANAPDRCRWEIGEIGDGGHRFYAEQGWAQVKALLAQREEAAD